MADTFKIIRNAPLPPRSTRGIPIYPFAEMAVGDAFDAPRDMGKSVRGADLRQRSVSAAARTHAKKKGDGRKFATRLVDDNTVRVWRLA